MPDTEPRPIGFKPPWPYRALVRRIVIGVAAVLVVAGLDAWWIGTRPPQVDAGDVVDLSSSSFSAYGLAVTDRVSVITPAASFLLSLGEPLDELVEGRRTESGTEPDDATVHEAPRGGSLLPIRWGPGARPAVVSPVEDKGDEQADDLARPTLSIAVDEEVVYGPVGLGTAPGAPGDAVAVAVRDSADVEVRITFDGATQTVDARTGVREAGLAQAYYEVRDPRFGDATCGFDRAPAPGVSYQGPYCSVQQLAVAPWRPGAGWVYEAGQAWAGASYRWIIPNAYETGRPSHFYGREGASLGDPRLPDGTEPDVLDQTNHRTSGHVRFVGWLLDEVPSRFTVESHGQATFRPFFEGAQGLADLDLTFRVTLRTGA